MIEQDKQDASESGESRRHFVARNVLAAAAVATSALLVRVRAADAQVVRRRRRCFLKGAKIDLVDGPCPVEDLVVGDRVPTLFGGLQPIQWIGRYAYRKSDRSRPWGKDARPVRIARSAIAPNVPNADLLVTPGHALFLDGVLVPAGSLINGVTITLDPAADRDVLEFFHIKLEGHDVISAQGVLVETLLTVDENAVNFAEYYRDFGMPQPEQQPCSPILSYNGGVSEVKSRMRSAISPIIDRRQRIDVIRDRLEARGLALRVVI